MTPAQAYATFKHARAMRTNAERLIKSGYLSDAGRVALIRELPALNVKVEAARQASIAAG